MSFCCLILIRSIYLLILAIYIVNLCSSVKQSDAVVARFVLLLLGGSPVKKKSLLSTTTSILSLVLGGGSYDLTKYMC
jgi:hypothetical protein